MLSVRSYGNKVAERLSAAVLALQLTFKYIYSLDFIFSLMKYLQYSFEIFKMSFFVVSFGKQTKNSMNVLSENNYL